MFDSLEAVYEEFPGWNTSTQEIREFNKAPEAFKAYIKRIEEFLGIPVAMASVGPERVLVQHWPWQPGYREILRCA